MIPSPLIKKYFQQYLARATRDELRSLLYEVAPPVPTEIVDVFAEVAAWDQQQRPRKRNVAAEVLRIINPRSK